MWVFVAFITANFFFYWSPLFSLLTDRLVSSQSKSSGVVREISRCVPGEIPQCVTHVKGFALKDDVAAEGSGADMGNMPQKRPVYRRQGWLR